MNPLELTRLEKAAADCGFELSPELGEDGLKLSSAQFPETVTVKSLSKELFVLQASSPLLLSQALSVGEIIQIDGWDSLYDALEMASATARTMPNRVAQKFHKATAAMPKSTEAERWVVQRIGQDLFRSALLDYWQGSCCITGLAMTELLRASHIKPWARCESDEERLDVFNGLLLAPHLDALFDSGWMTFDASGRVRFSSQLTSIALEQLGVPAELELARLTDAHQSYLHFHRDVVFKK
ncbi:MAG: HNH endonuclease [Rhodoferax sp.]|uniref:HNH endonuclease n=1 Tax=Rhodoferax sp. TaxID=50421 RepID=UPI0027255497|nr:HNH endonuclease [Rhodoferax sp.]MDO8450353.1 HNH endonuclease [Rhodoferax sp.]